METLPVRTPIQFAGDSSPFSYGPRFGRDSMIHHESNGRGTDRPEAEATPDAAHDALTARTDSPAVDDRLLNILGRYPSISLDRLDLATLLDRTDTKYLIPVERVPALLELVRDDYRVLAVAGRRVSGYDTTYYDTDGLALYLAHHAGRPNRAKVRTRTYRSTGKRFLELKMTRAGRTRKERAEMSSSVADTADLMARVAGACNAQLPQRLAPVLRVSYSRITLVSKTAPERVTIDFDLRYTPCRDELCCGALKAEGATGYSNWAIVEVKQPRRTTSPMSSALRKMGERSISMSKYCIGVATLFRSVKANRFKPTLTRLGAPDLR